MKDRIRDAFDGIHADAVQKQKVRDYLEIQRRQRAGRSRRMAPYLAAMAAAAVLLVFAGRAMLVRSARAVSYISIDVNPSIELALDSSSAVIEAKAYNQDGETVLQGLALDGKQYTEAIDLIVSSDAMQSYLTDSADLTFTVASQDPQETDRLMAGINGCEGCRKNRGMSYAADMSLLKQAHASGMSFGKYAVYEALHALDPSITVEQCRGMTMSEMHAMMRMHGGGQNCGMNGRHE